MPGETTANVTVAVAPSNAPQKSFPFVLKKIMDIPPPNILDDGDDEIEKEKLNSSGDGQSRGDGGGGGGGSGGSGGAGSVSASLTPAIWDKTIPYDGENFHLEYMDLDEFLLENGIPVALEEELQKSLEQERHGNDASASSTPAPEASEAATSLEVAPKVPAEKEKAKEVEKEKIKENVEEQDCKSDVAKVEVTENVTELKKDSDRMTPSPVNPEDIEVNINFQPDPTDLVLSSVPGGELFNPRKHKFTEEELKPQPMIKKAKKVFVPDDAKDEKYWTRRKKNNVAAKRSRDARRLKENQIAVRASFLERENAVLRQEVAELRRDCSRCKKIMSVYEAKYGPL